MIIIVIIIGFFLQTCALLGLYFLQFITSQKLCTILYGLLVRFERLFCI